MAQRAAVCLNGELFICGGLHNTWPVAIRTCAPNCHAQQGYQIPRWQEDNTCRKALFFLVFSRRRFLGNWVKITTRFILFLFGLCYLLPCGYTLATRCFWNPTLSVVVRQCASVDSSLNTDRFIMELAIQRERHLKLLPISHKFMGVTWNSLRKHAVLVTTFLKELCRQKLLACIYEDGLFTFILLLHHEASVSHSSVHKWPWNFTEFILHRKWNKCDSGLLNVFNI